MRLLGRRTIRQRLTTIGMLSSLTALVSASLVILVYDARTFREKMVRRLSIEARITSFNCVAPLLFSDADAAGTTLLGLRAEPAVVEAAVFTAGAGTPFARYAAGPRPAAGPPLAVPAAPGHAFGAGELLLAEPVDFEGRRIGTLVIRADLGELRDRQRRYVAIVAAALAGSFLVAMAISRIAEKTISRPILHLAETARAVSTRRDYSVRATVSGRDETSQLTATFNQMLDQIERQNADLEEARADLERRVEARTQDLEAANRELEAFSYSVSHDLRAPLRAIDGFSKALLSSYGSQLDERGRHYLERVRAGTQRTAELIDDLLGLARVSRRELVRQPVDVSALAGRVAGDLSARSAPRRVGVEIHEGMAANADPALLRIVLENLMGNAWKFTAKGPDGRVEVGRRMEGSEVVFYVRDNGAGFDMAYADKLFGAFQRLHDDADFEGTGIGLATVQRIVARHGGRAWAHGELGRGATFHFTLERVP